ncbi:efflux transporter outer membrane subunit [Uliginosibacterium flavum]|uniref:Efflux transporter outer membrane subunit n=1 Tax=Uliginosibacterium flavum TaxID=1396831 RepID=A0ABV2TQN7_9RHOO
MRNKLLSASLLVLLSACISVGPDYRKPAPVLPSQWYAAQSGSARGSLAGWWQLFDDPALTHLIDLALASSPDLRTAQAKLREARARTGVAESARYPAVTNSISAKRSESADKGVATDSYSIGFDASWEVDIFGGTRRSVEAAQATQEAAAESLLDAQVTLAAEVARTYLDLRTQQTRLQIARDNLLSQADTTQLTRWRAQAGLVTELDVAQASSTLEQSRARIPTLESAVEVDINKLAVLAGLPRSEVEARVGVAARLPITPTELGVTIPADTLRQRPDVRAAERRLAAQTASIGVATAAQYPSFKLSGNVGLAALSTDLLLRPEAASSSLLAGLTTPIFDAGRIRQNIAIQNALQEQSLIAYEKTVAQALADVENALVALAKSRERLQSLVIATDSARLAAQIAQQRYAAGLIDYGVLQDTQRSLLSVEDSRASAEGEQAAALVQLYKSLGGGFGEPAISSLNSGADKP